MSRDKILTGVLLAGGIGGLLPLGATTWWVFELFSHFRIQYLVIAVPLLFLAIGRRKAFLALLVAAGVLINARPLIAYLPTAAVSETDFRFDILNINVNADNRRYTETIDTISSADTALVSVIELTVALDQALLTLSERFPHRHSAPTSGKFGIGILSRFPLLRATEFSTGPTTAIDATIELPAGTIRFIATHLYPPMNTELARIRNRQLDELATYVAAVEGPIVVCGDFNLTPYSPFFERFTAAARLRDVRVGQGPAFSWPSFLPLAGIPIDHCLIRGPLAVDSVERLGPFGSDHYPVKVSLGWQDRE